MSTTNAGIDHIMVCADASPSAEAALAYAKELAAGLGADIKATHVFDITRIDPELGQYLSAQEQVRLRDEARKHELSWAEKDGVAVELVEGRSIPSLLELSNETDLVVVGRSGHGAVARFLLGSVAKHLVTHSTTPVLVVPPVKDDAGPATMKGKSVVVAVDGSTPSVRAAKMAATIAKATGAQLELVSIVDLSQVDVYEGFFMTEDQLARVEERVHQHELTEARQAIKDTDVEVVERVIRGNAKGLMLEQSQRDDIAMIVVGKTGKGAFERMLQGSLSRAMSTQADCPVLIVA